MGAENPDHKQTNTHEALRSDSSDAFHVFGSDTMLQVCMKGLVGRFRDGLWMGY